MLLSVVGVRGRGPRGRTWGRIATPFVRPLEGKLQPLSKKTLRNQTPFQNPFQKKRILSLSASRSSFFFYVSVVNFSSQWGQVILIFPFPLGTDSFFWQLGQFKTLVLKAFSTAWGLNPTMTCSPTLNVGTPWAPRAWSSLDASGSVWTFFSIKS